MGRRKVCGVMAVATVCKVGWKGSGRGPAWQLSGSLGLEHLQ